MITCTRHHDFSAGHRVAGHEGKCKNLHGHNYRIHFTCQSDETDTMGRVIDFGFMKSIFCQWLEENWDHKFLLWVDDPELKSLMKPHMGTLVVPFNPTAENMAKHLLGRDWRLHTDVQLTRVLVEETRKCSAEASS